MRYGTKVSNKSKTQLSFVVEAKSIELIAIRLNQSMSSPALDHRDVLALQQKICVKRCLEFAPAMLSVTALAVLVASEANQLVSLRLRA